MKEWLTNWWSGSDPSHKQRDEWTAEIKRIQAQLDAYEKEYATASDERRKELDALKNQSRSRIAELNDNISEARSMPEKAFDAGVQATENLAGSWLNGLSAWAANQRNRDVKAPNRSSAHLQQQANMHDVQAGDIQKTQQQASQIANRDYHSEAEKNAMAGAATENAQRVQNLSASAGAGAAALNREVKSADYDTMMNRQDTQRDKAAQYNKEMWDVRQTAQRERAGADNADYLAQQAVTANNTASELSNGMYQPGNAHWSDKRYQKPQEEQNPAPETESTEDPNNATKNPNATEGQPQVPPEIPQTTTGLTPEQLGLDPEKSYVTTNNVIKADGTIKTTAATYKGSDFNGKWYVTPAVIKDDGSIWVLDKNAGYAGGYTDEQKAIQATRVKNDITADTRDQKAVPASSR